MILTKLYHPKVDEHVVHRSSLFETLRNGLKKKVILVSATAGYGKTTLISDWINQQKITAAWCSLDNRDNDPSLFLNLLISSLNKQEKNIGQVSLDLLQKPGTASAEYILELFINDLLSLKNEIVLVLDDLHLIDNKQVFGILSTLIEYKPNQLKLILSTRSDPTIPFARLRSQNEILEIRSGELSFTRDDIAFLFNKKLKLGLKQNDFSILEKKTEGWIAGLQLTALSLKDQRNISEYLEKMAGDNRYIMDYLIEEVIQRLSQEERNFLLCTSILNRYNAPLCNSLLSINNSQDIIEDLEKNNMFIISLDNERNWFRYHHLFASLLQQRLTLHFKDKITELHESACQWFENNDQLLFALEHSLAAGNKQKALNHFASVINQLFRASQYQTILQFGGMFTHDQIVSNPGLCFNYFWILFQSGQMEQAESLITKLQKNTTDKAELAMVRVCINNLKISLGDIESTYSYSEMELHNINNDSDYWNIFAYLSLGEVHLFRFELEKSFQSYDQAALRASTPDHLYFEMINRVRSAFVLWLMGDYSRGHKETKALLDKFNKIAEKYGVAIELLSSMLNCVVGNFLVNTNQLEEGLQKSLRGFELSRKTTNGILIASCTYLLAEAYYLAGEYKKAIDLVEELDTIPYKQGSKFLCVLCDSLKSKLYLLTGDQNKSEPLYNRDISADKNHAFESIFSRIDKMRYQIANGKISESIGLCEETMEILNQEKACGLLAEVEILMAKAQFYLQNQNKAIEYMLNAIRKTQSVGLVRLFINEGEEIKTLLKEIKTLKSTRSTKELDSIDSDYINKLLRVFEKEKTRVETQNDETLSSRELDTLKLIAENLSNQEIANELFISITTVKTHVRNILLKLEAKNRNEAVLIAKEKGILSSYN